MLLGFFFTWASPYELTVNIFVLILGGGCLDGTPQPLLKAIFCQPCGVFFLASLLLAERNDQLTHTQHAVFVLQARQNVRCYNDSCHAWEGTKEAKTNKDTLRQPQR